jgi:hypothetical protein
MIRSASHETGVLQCVMHWLEVVEIIVAKRRKQAVAMAADVRSWRVSFKAGISLELREQMRFMQMADFRPVSRSRRGSRGP